MRGKGWDGKGRDIWTSLFTLSVWRLRRADDESFLVLPAGAHAGRPRSQRTL